MSLESGIDKRHVDVVRRRSFFGQDRIAQQHLKLIVAAEQRHLDIHGQPFGLWRNVDRVVCDPGLKLVELHELARQIDLQVRDVEQRCRRMIGPARETAFAEADQVTDLLEVAVDNFQRIPQRSLLAMR